MNNDELSRKEEERIRRLMQDSRLNEHLEQLRDPAYLEFLKKSLKPNQQLRDMELVIKQASERLATSLAPMDELYRQQIANIGSAHFNQLSKIQDHLALYTADLQRIPALKNFKTLQADFGTAQALKYDKLFRPSREIAYTLEMVRKLSKTELKISDAFQLNSRDLLPKTFSTSLRAALEVNNFIKQNASLADFPSSFAEQLLQVLPYPPSPSGVETNDVAFLEYLEKRAALLEFFVNWLKGLKRPSWTTVNTGFTLFMMLAVPIYQDVSSNRMEARMNKVADEREARINKRIEESEAKLAEEIKRLVPQTTKPIFYVVERTTKLKLGIKTSSPTVAVLPPNQIVELKKSRGKLIYVEYFHYLEGVPKVGWVPKKYLKQVTTYTNTY